MRIAFKTKKLKKIFNSEKGLRREYGKLARPIMRRMAVLEAAETLIKVPHDPPNRKHELSGQRKGGFAVDLDRRYRLVFEPNHSPIPRKEDGGIDLRRVTAIIIKGVEDYH